MRTSDTSGYFIDIFRSARNDGRDRKHEYLFHSQGEPILLKSFGGHPIATKITDELSSVKGDLVGYDYFNNKEVAETDSNFKAQFKMPANKGRTLHVNLWMKGFENRRIFTVEAPYSRAINKESVPAELYKKDMPTLVVRQNGEARSRPFVSIIEAFNQSEGSSVKMIDYFKPDNENAGFVGIHVQSMNDRQDFIFNDDNPKSENTFSDGNFRGRIGVVTLDNESIESMLLLHGKVLEYGAYGIRLKDRYGDVRVRLIPGGIEVESTSDFQLTMPVPESKTNFSKMVLQDEHDDQTYQGKLSTSGKAIRTVFDLPAMSKVELRYR